VQRGPPLRATLALFTADQAEGWTAGACLLGLIATLGGHSAHNVPSHTPAADVTPVKPAAKWTAAPAALDGGAPRP
jgi:hypothetical protein